MDNLKVTSPEEYAKLSKKKFKAPSGAVFEIKALGARPMVALLAMLPEDGLPEDQIVRFMRENLSELLEQVIQPGIVAPKIDNEDIIYADAIALLNEIMVLSGLSAEGAAKDESFRKKRNRKKS